MKKLLTEWRKFLNENKLRVFDFDDTLAKTDAKIILTKADGSVELQTPGEWAVYKPEEGDEFDYDQFRGALRNPRELRGYTKILRKVLSAGSDGRKAVILTARDDKAGKGILDFLEDIGIDTDALELVTLGDSDPERKADWIENKITQGYDDIFFIDDSEKNIIAVNKLKEKHPHIKLRTQLV